MSNGPPLEALVVDDEAEIRELLVEFLRGRGLPVASASDGRAAVTALQREPSRYNLVITDLALPGIDGLGVLRAAREVNPSCQVVIVTGYASLDSAIQAVRLGAYDYLTKPFSLGQIDVILTRLQDRLTLEAENRQLLHRLDRQEPSDGRQQLVARLDAIDFRLARLEAALSEFLERQTLRTTR
jgi:DNA-binding NtrC family response regulator